MDDGRRERIMIACLTFETVKIIDPIDFYQCTKAYVIHYVDEKSEDRDVYQQFYDYVETRIKSNNQDLDTVEIVSKVNDFSVMVKTVHDVISSERNRNNNSDIFVNLSAGTSEYIAAAAMTSMMFQGTIPFTVPTQKYTIPASEYFDKVTGEPIGITSSVSNPRVVPRFNIESPDRSLVLGLRILNNLARDNILPKGTDVIQLLKKNNLWHYRYANTDPRVDSVYYHRDFIDHWIRNDWVYKDRYQKKYGVTDLGKMTIRLFYSDEPIKM